MCSFHDWVVFHYIYIPQLLYPFMCQWTSSCFLVLTIVNSAAMNTGVHLSFSVLISSEYIPRSGISGSCSLISTFFFSLPAFVISFLFSFWVKDNCFTELCCFCQTSTCISHRYAYLPSLVNLPTISLPVPPRWVDTEPLPVWVSWARQKIPVGCLFYTW